MARIKYIRVSTKEQNTARQEQDKAQYDKVYLEKISGKDTNRPQLQAMLDYVREGDVVEVESYSRLARDTRDLLNIIDVLNKKGVAFVSQKEQIDTSTPAGRFMLSVFASLAQFEREQILCRQAEGIAIAKQEGRMGRPEIKPCDNFTTIVEAWKQGEMTAVERPSIARSRQWNRHKQNSTTNPHRERWCFCYWHVKNVGLRYEYKQKWQGFMKTASINGGSLSYLL